MTSRERVKRAIHFQGVDHIPHHLPDGKENDILWLWTPRVPDPQPWNAGADGLERRIDAYGVTWVRPVGEHNHGEKWGLPIADIARQAGYAMPDQNNPVFFEGARRGIADNNAVANPKYCLGVMPFSSLTEGTHNLMGLDKMFIAYYEEPDHLKALIARLAEGQRESIRRLHAIGCDGVMGYDDWARLRALRRGVLGGMAGLDQTGPLRLPGLAVDAVDLRLAQTGGRHVGVPGNGDGGGRLPVVRYPHQDDGVGVGAVVVAGVQRV